MSPLQRVLAIGVVPILALLTLHFFSPTTTSNLQDIVRLYARGTFIERLLPSTPTPRSSIPLIITCITHWSHLDKIASVAYELATLGYPITFLTGRVFEKQISSIHPNIKFSPFLGNDDKISEKDMQTMLSLPPEEHELFFSKKVLVDFMPDYHETLQQQAQSFRREHGQTKPLIFLHDHVLVGQHATALGAPGIRPDASIAISHTPITLDSNDTFPLRMGKVPHTGADAKAVHWAAYKEYYEQPFMKGLNEYFWAKLRQMGTHREPFPPIFHGMNSLPDYLLTQGIPEFEFPRSDVRRDIRYFGAFKKVQKFEDGGQGLPEWWDDVARAKKEGKRIISVSQGTVEVDPQQLTLPTIEALKDRDDVLLIATFVAMEPSDIPNLEVPRNTRVAKFVPYDLLLPYVSTHILSELVVASLMEHRSIY
jgi:UDP:flavonoid glycosyltransferase YjiC (YdhE family)